MDSSLLVNDLVENEVGSHNPLQDDDFKSPATGFPAPKKRVSAFKQRKAAAAAGAPAPANKPASTSRSTPQGNRGGPSTAGDDFYATEKRRIDRENRELLQGMAPAEIEAARRELMNGLDASLIERLFKRSNIDEQDTTKLPFDGPSESRLPPPTVTVEDVSEQAPAAAPKQPATPKAPSRQPVDEDRAPDKPPENLFPISDAPKSTHFPAPSDPDLDPSDPDFLESLHTKYFPNLPADPSKLAWMAPLPTEGSHADKESPYFPDQATVSTSALRFDFTGRLLPPRLSRSIPVSKGLHHHGQAPEAAGYTVEELSILARSAVPAQRCMAFQTLGRILYRLGNGEWGTTIDDAMAMGIWHSVKEGRVLDSLAEAAAQEHGHRSSQAFALEALWLFEKGGWKEKIRPR
ncbi:related to Plasmodium yoelii rhoptry protein [Cephalotrichum gorgonifer]|uniref:Related to Plasmodium yoelii rhoptry protein n=1 Tax=Cephalotrichum gorgonifer TaxID=2041049 RepID=A0AAE8MVA3_9PEZI|nr:related to Plasmodium yoelii rhoptry protein [Cephalotrichum gorgonifer]